MNHEELDRDVNEILRQYSGQFPNEANRFRGIFTMMYKFGFDKGQKTEKGRFVKGECIIMEAKSKKEFWATVQVPEAFKLGDVLGLSVKDEGKVNDE